MEAPLNEPVLNLHSQAGGNVTDDAGSGSDRDRCFSAIAGLGVASGRLPDHASPDVLPGSEPGGSDVFYHGPA